MDLTNAERGPILHPDTGGWSPDTGVWSLKPKPRRRYVAGRAGENTREELRRILAPRFGGRGKATPRQAALKLGITTQAAYYHIARLKREKTSAP